MIQLLFTSFALVFMSHAHVLTHTLRHTHAITNLFHIRKPAEPQTQCTLLLFCLCSYYSCHHLSPFSTRNTPIQSSLPSWNVTSVFCEGVSDSQGKVKFPFSTLLWYFVHTWTFTNTFNLAYNRLMETPRIPLHLTKNSGPMPDQQSLHYSLECLLWGRVAELRQPETNLFLTYAQKSKKIHKWISNK